MRTLKIRVYGNIWRVKFITAKQMHRITGRRAEGATDLSGNRVIYFDKEEMSKVLVLHELGHAYFYELPIKPARLTSLQVEEVTVEMYAEKMEEMVKTGRFILKFFRENS